MAEELEIHCEVDGDYRAYQIVNSLKDSGIYLIKYKGRDWNITDPEQLKYFLKDKYYDYETGEIVET